jgi:hypothetical protein
MGSSSQEDEAPRARRLEAGSGRGRVVMVGGRRRRRRFLNLRFFEWEAAIGQGATDARLAGLAERLRPSGERGSSWSKKTSGPRLGRLAAGPIGPKGRKYLG